MATIDVNVNSDGMPCSVVNLRVLSAATAFASKDENRHYLNGVCIELDERGATYVATDGHRMIVFRDDLGAGENLLTGRFIIPTSRCKSFTIDKKDDGCGKIFADGERLALAYGRVDVRFDPIASDYPNWRRSIPPKGASGALAQFDLLQLADFNKFGLALSLPPPFVAPNGDGPACIWYPGHQHVMGIIMPIKITDELARTPPDWTQPRPDDGDIEGAVGADNVADIASHKKRG